MCSRVVKLMLGAFPALVALVLLGASGIPASAQTVYYYPYGYSNPSGDEVPYGWYYGGSGNAMTSPETSAGTPSYFTYVDPFAASMGNSPFGTATISTYQSYLSTQLSTTTSTGYYPASPAYSNAGPYTSYGYYTAYPSTNTSSGYPYSVVTSGAYGTPYYVTPYSNSGYATCWPC